MNPLRRLIRNTSGQDMIEYALLVGLLACAATFALIGIGDGTSNALAAANSALTAAATPAPSGAGAPTTPDAPTAPRHPHGDHHDDN